MKTIFFLLFSFLSIINLYAQEGGYFLTHYSAETPEHNTANFDIVQNKEGIICIANRSGVLLFDGKNWEKIPTPTAIFSLALGADKTIYAGGVDGFGKISRGTNAYLTYDSLNIPEAKNIYHILVHENILYGINETSVFIIDLSTQAVRKVDSKYSGALTKLLLVDNKVHVNSEIGGIKLIGQDKLETPSSADLDGDKIQFISSDFSRTLIGHQDGSLSLLVEGKLQLLDLKESNDYIKEMIPIDAGWINPNLIGIATLKGGVVFINPKEQKVEQVINYQNGLPDNEIFDISIDRFNGLWVAHNEGFTRISPNFPYKAYDRYPGLEGELLSVEYHDNTLYVGTSIGLFYLDTVKKYSTKKIIETKEVKSSSEFKKVEDENKGLFSFLKRNKKEEPQVQKPKISITYVTKTEKTLESVSYEYRKISPINSKVFNLSSRNGRLFCGGLDGLYEIIDQEAFPISNSPIRKFYASAFHNKVFVNTYSDSFEVFDISNTSYKQIPIFTDYHNWISDIFEDGKHRIWFCSNNEIFYIKLDGNEIEDSEEIKISNPFFDETYGVNHRDTILFINNSGLFWYKEDEKSVSKSTPHPYNKYLKDNSGTVWVLDHENWKTLGTEFSFSKLNTLSLFSNIQRISYDRAKETFWVLTENNSLYKFESGKEIDKSIAAYELFLKEIHSGEINFVPEKSLKISQENSALIFEFVQPEYSGILKIEYQYKIEGLSDSWSEWSENHNVISIPYLPDGDYTITMRSKNIVSGIKETEPYSFTVVPPYWKRPWFLALEFSALGFLLFLSVRMKKLGYKYRMLSRLLALLTLIIIIEFIQTIAENEFGSKSSAIIDFIIQITVAIIILPVESLVRKYILKEENVQILDFISIKKNKDEKP